MAVIARLGWKIVGTGSGVLAGIVTRKVLNSVWQRTKGGQPPANPQQVDVSWREAVTWTVASSAGIGVSRLLAGRMAAGAWTRATGHLPPGMSASSGTDPEPGRPLPRR